MAGSHQDAAGVRSQAVYVARPHQVARMTIRIDGHLNRSAAIESRGAGFYAGASVELDGEVGAHAARVFPRLRTEVEALANLPGHCQAQDAARLREHEVHGL